MLYTRVPAVSRVKKDPCFLTTRSIGVKARGREREIQLVVCAINKPNRTDRRWGYFKQGGQGRFLGKEWLRTEGQGATGRS